MTLCLAWKTDKGLSFAADSRLSNGSGRITDNAAKVFKINISIEKPSNEKAVTEKLAYSSNFGICFTGSYLNGSLLADSMNLFFSKIQAAPGFSDTSIDNLSTIAFNIYKQVSTQLSDINRLSGLSQVLFGGHCPLDNSLHLYLFKFSFNPNMSYQKEEIELNRLPIFIGDDAAKQKANILRSKISKNYSYYHLLEEIIQDDTISSVGGDIQTGTFENYDFDVYGILDYFIDESTDFPKVKSSFRFRGLEIDFDTQELRKGYINPSISFMNPFEKRRQEYFAEIERRLKSGEF